MPTDQIKIQHLYHRAAFGIHPVDLHKKKNSDLSEIVTRLFAESVSYKDLNLLDDPRNASKDFGALKILKQILKSNRDLQRLNVHWTDRMAGNKGILRERMTYFWHNHFATNVPFAVLMQEQNNTLRKHALGNFREMLIAIARDPAMILFLNNQQNKKKAPNENFARELMELFTLGIGNYTEKDIKEAARAFTGWHINLKGYFEFNKEDHDDGDKTFMGQRGNFDGSDIIRIILEQPAAAQFICKKIYREFVNSEPDETRISELADYFRSNDYNIGLLMLRIFSSDWFYDQKHVGVKIKSPVELIVGLKRLVNLQWKDEMNQVRIQKTLGQILFFPPNVAGWPGDKNWIDSSSLLLRMSLPHLLFGTNTKSIKLETKQDPEMEIGGKNKKLFAVKSNWQPLESAYSDNKEDLVLLVSDLIVSPVQATIRREIPQQRKNEKDHAKKKKSSPIELAAIQVMTYPEFQLC